MADSIRIAIDDHEVLSVLDQIAQHLSPAGMAPAMKEIGEALTESTQQRFSTSTGPDGQRWAPLAEGTVLSRLAQISGAYGKKDGKLNKKGSTAVMGMKPLVESGLLAGGIHYQLISGGAGVEIGTNRFAGEWEGGAAVHQFGSSDGRIPARPFLGLSDSDRSEVLDILNRFLEDAIGQ